MTEDDLKVLVARAKRVHRGNVSAVVHDLVATLRREEAMDRLLAKLGSGAVTDEELSRLRDEIASAPLPRGRRRPAA